MFLHSLHPEHDSGEFYLCLFTTQAAQTRNLRHSSFLCCLLPRQLYYVKGVGLILPLSIHYTGTGKTNLMWAHASLIPHRPLKTKWLTGPNVHSLTIWWNCIQKPDSWQSLNLSSYVRHCETQDATSSISVCIQAVVLLVSTSNDAPISSFLFQFSQTKLLRLRKSLAQEFPLFPSNTKWFPHQLKNSDQATFTSAPASFVLLLKINILMKKGGMSPKVFPASALALLLIKKTFTCRKLQCPTCNTGSLVSHTTSAGNL